MASTGIVLVLVAHNGKTLQLDVGAQTRVDAVQHALVSFTGVPIGEQILMCHGARLDPAKPLSAYKLPVLDPAAAEDHPVFLYHKAFLRPGARPPPQEPVPAITVQVPQLAAVTLRHPLEAAHSPLVRALPEYERQFEQQLVEARAYWETSQQRMHWCRQLLSEQEVQARAADAARANVEGHYTYICTLYQSFVDRYVPQYKAHSQILVTFQELTAALVAVTLPQQLQIGGCVTLADLQPQGRLAEWYDSCKRSHEHFAVKVSELEGLFQLLRGDVEALFMQAPTVDLDALGLQLGDSEQLIDEQGSAVQVLSKDLRTVRELVEDVVAQLGASAGGASLSGAKVHDAAAALEAIHDSHLGQLLPRVRQCDELVADFLSRCVTAKGAMGRDVLEQLQRIAAQQSRIREMKDKLAAFGEVLSRQAAAFAELRAATRLPAAYRLMLTECARRSAWQTMYSAQATRLAEAMARVRERDSNKREAFLAQVDRLLPRELLVAAGLMKDPPHCQVSVPPGDEGLLRVDLSDVQRLPAILERAAADMAAAAAATALTAQGAPGEGQQAAVHAQQQQQQQTGGAGAAAAAGEQQKAQQAAQTRQEEALQDAVAGLGGLELENARLKAELAAQLALQAISELSGDGTGRSGGAPSAASSQQLAAAAAAPAPLRAFARGSGPPEVPASVRAPLPSVSELVGRQGEGAGAAVAEGAGAGEQAQQQAAGVLALSEVKAALEAKDAYAQKLHEQLAEAAAALESQERRISELEAALEEHFGAQNQARLDELLARTEAGAAAGGQGQGVGAGGDAQQVPGGTGDQQEHQQQQQQGEVQSRIASALDPPPLPAPSDAGVGATGPAAVSAAVPQAAPRSLSGALPAGSPGSQPHWHPSMAHSVFSVGSVVGGSSGIAASSMRGVQSVWAAAPRLPAGSPLGVVGGAMPLAAPAAVGAAVAAPQPQGSRKAAAPGGGEHQQPASAAGATGGSAAAADTAKHQQQQQVPTPTSPGAHAALSNLMTSSMRYLFRGGHSMLLQPAPQEAHATAAFPAATAAAASPASAAAAAAAAAAPAAAPAAGPPVPAGGIVSVQEAGDKGHGGRQMPSGGAVDEGTAALDAAQEGDATGGEQVVQLQHQGQRQRQEPSQQEAVQQQEVALEQVQERHQEQHQEREQAS